MIKTTTQTAQQLGKWAENYAKQQALQQGFTCISQNYRCRNGELDLILEKDNLLIFMEIKARSNTHYGHAVEMLTPQKQRHMMNAITHFLAHFPQYTHHDYRFDLFAIQFHQSINNLQELERLNQNRIFSYEWIENAFLWQDF